MSRDVTRLLANIRDPMFEVTCRVDNTVRHVHFVKGFLPDELFDCRQELDESVPRCQTVFLDYAEFKMAAQLGGPDRIQALVFWRLSGVRYDSGVDIRKTSARLPEALAAAVCRKEQACKRDS